VRPTDTRVRSTAAGLDKSSFVMWLSIGAIRDLRFVSCSSTAIRWVVYTFPKPAWILARLGTLTRGSVAICARRQPW
jgi:hypothetical protein